MNILSKWFVSVLAVLFFWALAAVSPAAESPQPGSEADPLVTRAWTDRYIQAEFAKVRADVAALEQKVAALKINRPVLLLTVGSATATVDNKPVTMDVPAQLVGSRVFVPLRFVGEAFGVPFLWDGAAKQISYSGQAGPVVLVIGQKSALVNGVTVALDGPAMIQNGRTLVPLRFISESLGAVVTWHGAEKKVEIR